MGLGRGESGISAKLSAGFFLPFLNLKNEGRRLKTYYCLMSEFYDNGSVKAAVISRDCKEKPENSFKDTPISDCYKDWYDTQAAAKKALAQYRALYE